MSVLLSPRAQGGMGTVLVGRGGNAQVSPFSSRGAAAALCPRDSSATLGGEPSAAPSLPGPLLSLRHELWHLLAWGNSVRWE